MYYAHRMQVLLCTLLTLFLLNSWAQSADSVPTLAMPGQQEVQKTLVIGVDSFVPPFVMQGGHGELYGYDISMMNSICKLMQRNCKFQPIKWIKLLPAVMNNQVDLVVSSITITPERAKQMNFSLPYGLSYSRFLTNSSTPVNTPFTFSALDGKRIGVYEGTIYEDQASHIGMKNPIIKSYGSYQDVLKALTNNKIDYILLDNPTALYWAANSSGAFKVVGAPNIYGFGIGIVISNQNRDLIPAINQALLKYLNSDDYKQNYKRYLESF